MNIFVNVLILHIVSNMHTFEYLLYKNAVVSREVFLHDEEFFEYQPEINITKRKW